MITQLRNIAVLIVLMSLLGAGVAGAQSNTIQFCNAQVCGTFLVSLFCPVPLNLTATPNTANGTTRFSWTMNAPGSGVTTLGSILTVGSTQYPLAISNSPNFFDVDTGTIPLIAPALTRGVCVTGYTNNNPNLPLLRASLPSNSVIVYGSQGQGSNPLTPAPSPASFPAPAPTPSSNITPSTPSAFSIGTQVRATDSLNVRSGPGITNSRIGRVPRGTVGTITDGPVVANQTWYKVRWNTSNALEGWSVRDGLEFYSAPSNTSPAPAPAPTPNTTTPSATTQPPVPTTLPPTPTTNVLPALVAPTLSFVRLQDGSITFSWTNPNTSVGTSGYVLQWKSNPTGTYPSGQRMVFQSNQSSYTISSLTNLQGSDPILYFTIKALGSLGASADSPNSNEITVSTNPLIVAPPAPAPTTSSAPATSLTPVTSTAPPPTVPVAPPVVSPPTPAPAPAPVTNLVPTVTVTPVTAQPTTFNVSWSAVPSGNGYRITRYFNSAGYPSTIIATIYNPNITQYIDVFLPGANGSSAIVYYQVQVLGSSPSGTYGSSVGFSAITQPPASTPPAPAAPLTPVNITVQSPDPYVSINSSSQRSARIRWDNPSGATGNVLYRIERSYSSSFANPVAFTTTASGGRLYDDIIPFGQGTNYPTSNQAYIYYRVSASNSAGVWSLPSATASVLAN